MTDATESDDDEFYEVSAEPLGFDYLAIASLTGRVKVCNLLAPSDDDFIKLANHDHAVWALTSFVSPTTGEKSLVSGGDDGLLRMWDLSLSGQLLRTLSGHTDVVSSLQSTTIGPSTYLLSGSFDKTVRVWEPLASEQETVVLRGHSDYVLAVAGCSLRRDALHPVSGSRDSTIIIWDIHNPGPLLTLLGHTTHIFSIICIDGADRDGTARLASCSGDASIRLWEIKSTEGRCLMSLEHHSLAVTALCSLEASASNSTPCWASGSKDATIRVWDVDGILVCVLRGHTAPVHALAASSAEPVLASGSVDGTVRLWNPLETELPKVVIYAYTNPVTAIAIICRDTQHGGLLKSDNLLRRQTVESGE